MFSIISPIKIIVLACQIYAAITTFIVITLALINPELSASDALKVVLGGAGALEVSLLVLAHFFWRKLWAKIPKLNEILFPDLNGDWNMNITWNSNGENGTVAAIATIKQSLISVSMEVRSKGSDSETIVVKTSKDSISGRPLIYYFYRVIPKNIDTDASLPYEGASTLKLFTEEGGILRGNYFTSRNTKGHFELTR
ncbi:Cap15 family cyclic dinucleotide receptor domain-containing protein [Pseudomonas koreensis]